MADISYAIHESATGYALVKITLQSDVVGNRLKEVQDASQDLAKFGKMIEVVSFAPYR